MISSAVDSKDLQQSTFGVIQQVVLEFDIVEQMLIAVCERLSEFANVADENLNSSDGFDKRIEKLTKLVAAVRDMKLPAFESSNMLKILLDSVTNIYVLKLRLDQTAERLRDSEAPEAQHLVDLRLISEAIRKQAEAIYGISDQMNDVDKTIVGMFRAFGRKCLSLFNVFPEIGRY